MPQHYYVSIREDLKNLSVNHRKQVYSYLNRQGLVIPDQNITTLTYTIRDNLLVMSDKTKVLVTCMHRRDYLCYKMGISFLDIPTK